MSRAIAVPRAAHQVSMARRWSLTLASLSLLAAGTVSAQTMYKWESFEKRVDSAQTVAALGTDLFGDSVGLQTGTLSFSVTDVDLPGNNALPVRFARSYTVANSKGQNADHMLADWIVDVPRMSGRFATEWLAGTSTNRCSNLAAPAVPAAVSGYFETKDFWQGVRLEIPGVASGELLVSAAIIAKPTGAPTPYLWTTDGQVQLRCLTGIASGGEGFVAITPDGTTYQFDKMAQRAAPTLRERLYDSAGALSHDLLLQVKENTLYASLVTDRFGNTVSYTYSNAANSPGRLTKILSSDGRQIDITYVSDRIYQVKAGTPASPGTRIWTYTYEDDASPVPKKILGAVQLPDGNAWDIQFRELTYSPIVYMPDGVGEPGEDGLGPPARSCLEAPLPDNGSWPLNTPAPTVLTGKLVHPSGATGTFTLGLQEHHRTGVSLTCSNVTSIPAGSTTGNGNIQKDDIALVPVSWYDWTLQQKTISAAGLATLTWDFAYNSTPSFVLRGGATGSFPYCNLNLAACFAPEISSDTGAGRATTTVTLPNGYVERHTFGNTWQYDEGKLLKTERGFVWPASSVESVTHTYDLSRADQTPSYPARFGTSLRGYVDGFTSEMHRPKLSTVTARDGATFNWSVDTNCYPSPNEAKRCLDTLARPTKVTKSSSLPHTKTETYTYADHPSKWVLGQLATTKVGTTTVAAASYDPTYAMMTQFSAFGQVQQTLAYDTISPVTSGQLGTLSSVTDGNTKTTFLSNWYRGVPQTITYPGGASVSAVANENAFGWITSTTDELGNKTCYRQDQMGRTDLITRSSEAQSGVCDGTAWQTTSIVYTKVASPEYGILANHWRRTETTGASIKETYFDGLWRPILQRQRTTDNSAGERFERKAFDHEGRETFASYAVDSVTTYDAVTTGVDTTYDALGRVTATSADTELGVRTTSTLYPSPFKTQHTNARGKVTTTTYQAFDTPSYDAPLETISSLDPDPGSITSTYTRNVYGNPTTLTRGGTWTNPNLVPPALETPNPVVRTFVYDSYQRLCKTIEPDAGVTVFDYDGAGNLAWKATGQNTLTSTTVCQNTTTDVPVTSRSVNAYDGRNRLLGINHPTGTDDVGYTYFADGAMQTATVGTLSTLTPVAWSTTRNAWTYTYNKRRLLDSESLVVDNKPPLLLDWSYAPNGALSGLIYPSTHAVTFNPNAYGEPRQVVPVVPPPGISYYANTTNTSYHASGLLTNFTYGSGATRAITVAVAPNTRNLPGRILDSYSSTKLLDHTLTYDGNANLKAITDGVVDPQGQPSESRTLTYDGRDRLISVTGAPSGDETYTYDPFDRTRRTVINGVERRFNYHATTQRLSQITTVGSPVVRDYTWNARGELSSRSLTQPGTMTVVPPTIYRHGFEESVLTTTEPFTFDQAGRLIDYNFSITYQYDAHGHRVATVMPVWGTRYQVYSRAGELLYVEDGGTSQRTEFFHLNGSLVAERTRPTSSETPTVSYLHSDHRGSPTVKSATGGARVYRSRLKPYGDPYDGLWREGPGFTKHAMDEAGNFVYMQQRYYDPTTLGFLSPDSVGANVDSFSRYWYANANPYTLVDPDGREACTGSRLSCPSRTINGVPTSSRADLARQAAGRDGRMMLRTFTAPVDAAMSTYEAFRDGDKVGIAAAIVGAFPAGKIAGAVTRVATTTRSTMRIGQQMHRAYKADLVDGVARFKEFRFATGRRADFIDFENGIIYELKPNNARSIREGSQQLRQYLLDAQSQFPGVNWRTVLDTY